MPPSSSMKRGDTRLIKGSLASILGVIVLGTAVALYLAGTSTISAIREHRSTDYSSRSGIGANYTFWSTLPSTSFNAAKFHATLDIALDLTEEQSLLYLPSALTEAWDGVLQIEVALNGTSDTKGNWDIQRHADKLWSLVPAGYLADFYIFGFNYTEICPADKFGFDCTQQCSSCAANYKCDSGAKGTGECVPKLYAKTVSFWSTDEGIDPEVWISTLSPPSTIWMIHYSTGTAWRGIYEYQFLVMTSVLDTKGFPSIKHVDAWVQSLRTQAVTGTYSSLSLTGIEYKDICASGYYSLDCSLQCDTCRFSGMECADGAGGTGQCYFPGVAFTFTYWSTLSPEEMDYDMLRLKTSQMTHIPMAELQYLEGVPQLVWGQVYEYRLAYSPATMDPELVDQDSLVYPVLGYAGSGAMASLRIVGFNYTEICATGKYGYDCSSVCGTCDTTKGLECHDGALGTGRCVNPDISNTFTFYYNASSPINLSSFLNKITSYVTLGKHESLVYTDTPYALWDEGLWGVDIGLNSSTASETMAGDIAAHASAGELSSYKVFRFDYKDICAPGYYGYDCASQCTTCPGTGMICDDGALGSGHCIHEDLAHTMVFWSIYSSVSLNNLRSTIASLLDLSAQESLVYYTSPTLAWKGVYEIQLAYSTSLRDQYDEFDQDRIAELLGRIAYYASNGALSAYGIFAFEYEEVCDTGTYGLDCGSKCPTCAYPSECLDGARGSGSCGYPNVAYNYSIWSNMTSGLDTTAILQRMNQLTNADEQLIYLSAPKVLDDWDTTTELVLSLNTSTRVDGWFDLHRVQELGEAIHATLKAGNLKQYQIFGYNYTDICDDHQYGYSCKACPTCGIPGTACDSGAMGKGGCACTDHFVVGVSDPSGITGPCVGISHTSEGIGTGVTGGYISHTLQLTSVGDQPVPISGMESSGEFTVAAHPTLLHPGSSMDYTVSLLPLKAAKYTGTVSMMLGPTFSTWRDITSVPLHTIYSTVTGATTSQSTPVLVYSGDASEYYHSGHGYSGYQIPLDSTDACSLSITVASSKTLTVEGTKYSLTKGTPKTIEVGYVYDKVLDILGGSITSLTIHWRPNTQSMGARESYSEALHLMYLYLHIQRSGKLDYQRVAWRGDACLGCVGDYGEDLSGGYYEAGGSYLKLGFHTAASLSQYGWNLLEYEAGHRTAGQYAEGLEAMKWGLDYILHAHVSDSVFAGQLGSTKYEFAYVGPPEASTHPTPVYYVTKSDPCTEIIAESAAALAIGSALFKNTDSGYSSKLLSHAKRLYSFATKYQRSYMKSTNTGFIQQAELYPSTGYIDELSWAAYWLYKATGQSSYLGEAHTHYKSIMGEYGGWAYDWNDKSPALSVLLSRESTDGVYMSQIHDYFAHWLDTPYRDVPHTPKGFPLRYRWGSIRYAGNTAFLALVTSQYVSDSSYSKALEQYATHIVDYSLGRAGGRGYVTGYGDNFTKYPYHKPSFNSYIGPTDWTWDKFKSSAPNPFIAYGAVIGGPVEDQGDWWYGESRGSYTYKEPTIDYGMGLTGALAALVEIHGGTPYSDCGLHLGWDHVNASGKPSWPASDCLHRCC